jgi:hypothetical protein
MGTRWLVVGAVVVALTGCSDQARSTGGGDAVEPRGPSGGGFVAQPLGPALSSAAVPADQVEPDEPRGTEEWRVTRPAAGRIAAYTTRISADPGTRVELRVSTRAGGYRVWAYRIGGYAGGTGRLVWRSRFLPGERQPDAVLDPVATRTVVAPWHRSLTIGTDGWAPGFYVLKLRTGGGWETAVPYVVRSPSAKGTVALVSPVTTWQAYNQWGGHSLYHGPDGDRRSWAVSYDRPFNLATGANDYRTAAIPVIVRAERLGIPLSYYANVDLDEDPAVLEGARGYVSMVTDTGGFLAMVGTLGQVEVESEFEFPAEGSDLEVLVRPMVHPAGAGRKARQSRCSQGSSPGRFGTTESPLERPVRRRLIHGAKCVRVQSALAR